MTHLQTEHGHYITSISYIIIAIIIIIIKRIAR